MYQIDIGKFKQLLQTVTNFRTSLEATNDFLGTQIAAIRECSYGETRAIFIEGMMLLRTEYYKEIQRIRGVETVLTDALNSAVLLKDRIRKLENVARGEDVYYGEGILANEAEYDGIIAFDESTVENVTRLCTHMTDFADQLETMINGVEDSVSGLVDLETEADQLRADCNKARIAGVYGTEYCKIGELMEALNEQVKTGLLPYTPEYYREVTADAVKASYTRYADAYLGPLLLYGTEEEKYQETLKLLGQEELTEAETQFVCFNIDCYNSTGNEEKLSGIADALMTKQYEYRETGYGSYWYCTAEPRSDIIEELTQTSGNLGLPNAYWFGCMMEEIDAQSLRVEGEGSAVYEVTVSADERGKNKFILSLSDGAGNTAVWQEAETSTDWGISYMSDSEVVETFEAIPEHNVFVRTFSDEKESDYEYKQRLANRYFDIKMLEGQRLAETYGILEDLDYLYGDVPYMDGQELKDWQEKQLEVYNRYVDLEEQGVDFTWIEYYYNRVKGEETLDWAAEEAEKDKVGASAMSVLTKALTSPFAAAYQLSCFVTGEAIDSESGIYGGIEISQTIRQTVKDDFGDGKAGQIAGIVYDGTMSLADYGTANVTTGGNGWALLATEGYAESGQQAAIRGLDPNAIQLEGLAAATGDILMDRTLGSAFKSGGFLKNTMAGGTTSAGEGMFNRGVDRFVAGELSYWDQDLMQLRGAGYSREEAERYLYHQEWETIKTEYNLGAFMGGGADIGGRLVRGIGEGPTIMPLDNRGSADFDVYKEFLFGDSVKSDGSAVKGVETSYEKSSGEAHQSGKASSPIENGPYVKNGKPNGRPGPRGKDKIIFEQAVYNNQVGADGVLREPYHPYRVIDWKPGEPRKGVVDFGHKKGKSYHEEFIKYITGEISLKELKEFQSNPDNFRIEIPSSNRDHSHE